MTNPCTPEIASDTLLQCDIAQRATDAQNSTSGGYPLNANTPPPGEVANIYNLLRGYSRQFFPLIPYKRLLTQPQELDDVHGEISETQKRWSAYAQLRAYPVPTLITQPLTEFGIEDARKADLLVTVPDLLDAGLITQDPVTFEITLVGGIGDRFFHHNREYDILTFTPAAYWANSDIPLYYQLKGELFRQQSVDIVGET